MSAIGTVVIGGGASGLMAASVISRAGEKVLLLEARDRVGKKLLATGNGRCNLSNIHVTSAAYGTDFVRSAFEQYPFEKIRDVFRSLGIPYHVDEEGRCYPMSLQAAGVLDALRYANEAHGTQIRCDSLVTAIGREKNGFVLRVTGQSVIRAKKVIVACGGCAAPSLGGTEDGYRLLRSLGHRMTSVYPALCPIPTDPKAIRGLKGVRARCRLTLLVDGNAAGGEKGEVLFGADAVSGICAMQLAGTVAKAAADGKKVQLQLSFGENGWGLVRERVADMPGRPARELLNGTLPKLLAMHLAQCAGIGVDEISSEIGREKAEKLGRLYEAWCLPAYRPEGFETAQVALGGIDTRDFHPESMESKLVPGSYATGEVLDVTGGCGGFNLHWAWASALCAANDIVRKLR